MSYTIQTMITREEVEARIKALAKQIEEEYREKKEIILIGLLKGSVLFMTDLMKEMDLDIKIDFMSVSSYGSGTTTTGVVKILKDVDFDVKGKELLIVEDIIDTGLTLKYVQEFLYAKGAKEIKVCTLLDKPERRKTEIKGDHLSNWIQHCEAATPKALSPFRLSHDCEVYVRFVVRSKRPRT